MIIFQSTDYKCGCNGIIKAAINPNLCQKNIFMAPLSTVPVVPERSALSNCACDPKNHTERLKDFIKAII